MGMKNIAAILALAFSFNVYAQCPQPAETVDPNATAETQDLFVRLRTLAATQLLVGHEKATGSGVFMVRPDGTVNWRTDGIKSDIRTICGAGPAVLGIDVANVVGDWWNGASNFDALVTTAQNKMRRDAQLQHGRGGIITMAWHMDNPITGGNYGHGPRELWRILPPEKCPEVLRQFPNLVGCGSHHDKFKAKVDVAAEWFNTVVDENGVPIPIVFRLFHENSGGWFWWGASRNPNPQYRAVFRGVWSWMVDYMTDTWDVHNLLYAISPNGGGKWHPLTRQLYLDYGPGMDLVDVVGWDFYSGDISPVERTSPPTADWQALPELRMIVELAREHGKIAAVTEIGKGGLQSYPASCDLWSDKLIGPILNDPIASGVAWFLMWTNHPTHTQLGPVPGHCSGDIDFRSVCDLPEVLLEGQF